jgi:signal transduction histidine kinase
LLEVADDGRGAAASVNGGGHGLAGIRERVSVYSGDFAAGGRSEGGYAVRARLRTHVAHVRQKLDLRDRVQAVVLAYESGLVRPGL